MKLSASWPAGTLKVGSMGLPSWSSTLQASAMRWVLATASGTSLKKLYISSGLVT